MSTTDDKAQSVLLERLHELQPQLPAELVLTCYRVEREHQFDRDADVVINQLRRLVDRALDDELVLDSGKDKKERRP